MTHSHEAGPQGLLPPPEHRVTALLNTEPRASATLR